MAKAAACSRAEGDPQHVALTFVVLVRLLVVHPDLLEHDDDAVELLVVGDADGADDPLELLGPVELEVVGQVSGAAELLDDPAEIAGQHGHLLLLDLDRRLGQALAAVEEEQAAAHLSHHPDRAVVRCVEVVLVAHEGTSSSRAPVEFTLEDERTAGAEEDGRDGAGGDGDALHEVERDAGGRGHDGLDRIGMGHGHDRLARVLGHQVEDGLHGADGHLGEGLAAGKAEPLRASDAPPATPCS